MCTGAGAHVGQRNAMVLRRPDVYVTQCVNGIDPLHEGEGQALQGGLWNTRFVRNACSSSSRFLGVVPCLECGRAKEGLSQGSLSGIPEGFV